MLNVSVHMREYNEVKAVAKHHDGITWLNLSDCNGEVTIYLTPQGAAVMLDALNEAIQLMDDQLEDRYVTVESLTANDPQDGPPEFEKQADGYMKRTC